MNEEMKKEEFEKLNAKFGSEKLGDILNGMLDIMCATGSKKALVMKNYTDTRDMIQNEIEKYFMPNLENDEIVEKFYKFMTALKEQTKQIIEDFNKEMEEK